MAGPAAGKYRFFKGLGAANQEVRAVVERPALSGWSRGSSRDDKAFGVRVRASGGTASRVRNALCYCKIER
jgi:hypothetical protein